MTVDPGSLAAELQVTSCSRATLLEAADLIEQVVVPLWAVWSETKPPCPTCGGKMVVWSDMGYQCPCCDSESPGVQPFNNWVAGLAAENERLRKAAELLQANWNGGTR